MQDDVRTTIARVAQEEGIDPAYALAVAERESKFNPAATASRSIGGLYQMTGSLRNQYGAGNSTDPEVQTRAFAAFTRDLQGEMAQRLGRQPTNAETYLGHFWGPGRAAGVIQGRGAGLSPADTFTPTELAQNPELARGSSTGSLASTIMGDINRRTAAYGGAGGAATTGNSNGIAGDFASYGDPKGFDFSTFGQPADDQNTGPAPILTGSDSVDATSGRPGADIDVSQFGSPAPSQPSPVSQIGATAPAPASARSGQFPGRKDLAAAAVTDSASRLPDEIPPDAILAGKGIAPSRKNGDAMDYSTQDPGIYNSVYGSPNQNI